jgi:hypothetical protein
MNIVNFGLPMGNKAVFLGAILMGLSPVSYGAENNVEKTPLASVTIMKIEGKGTARVRNRAGLEAIAGERQELSDGDRVITDGATVVQLYLLDGTIVRVGFNTEYLLERTDEKSQMTTWAFRLLSGTIRALVEKTPDRGTAKFRVNTPTGTMGVRGTELVLTYTPETKTTLLQTIEGKVEFGAPGCERNNSCIIVVGGQTSSISSGQTKPEPLKPLDPGALMGLSSSDQKAKTPAIAELFVMDAKDESAIKAFLARIDPKEIQKALAAASETLALAQDSLLNRSKEDREFSAKAVREGRYDEVMSKADKLFDQGIPPDSDFRSENTKGLNRLGPVAAAKARLVRVEEETKKASEKRAGPQLDPAKIKALEKGIGRSNLAEKAGSLAKAQELQAKLAAINEKMEAAKSEVERNKLQIERTLLEERQQQELKTPPGPINAELAVTTGEQAESIGETFGGAAVANPRLNPNATAGASFGLPPAGSPKAENPMLSAFRNAYSTVVGCDKGNDCFKMNVVTGAATFVERKEGCIKSGFIFCKQWGETVTTSTRTFTETKKGNLVSKVGGKTCTFIPCKTPKECAKSAGRWQGECEGVNKGTRGQGSK